MREEEAYLHNAWIICCRDSWSQVNRISSQSTSWWWNSLLKVTQGNFSPDLVPTNEDSFEIPNDNDHGGRFWYVFMIVGICHDTWWHIVRVEVDGQFVGPCVPSQNERGANWTASNGLMTNDFTFLGLVCFLKTLMITWYFNQFSKNKRVDDCGIKKGLSTIN